MVEQQSDRKLPVYIEAVDDETLAPLFAMVAVNGAVVGSKQLELPLILAILGEDRVMTRAYPSQDELVSYENPRALGAVVNNIVGVQLTSISGVPVGESDSYIPGGEDSVVY
jgi:hypothetical protein